MKFKPIYVYLFIFIAVLIAIVVFSTSSNDGKDNTIVSSDSMPNDNIHKSFDGQNNINPSSSNVSSSIIKKMNELDKYVNANPNDTAKVKEYADLLAGAHNQKKALELYKSILDVDMKRTDILSNIAIMLFNQSNFSEARVYIKKIIKIEPNNTEAIYNLGVIDVRIGEIEAAKKQWEDLLLNHPNSKMSKIAKESLEKLDKTEVTKK